MSEPTYAKQHHLRVCADRVVMMAARANFERPIDDIESQIRESLRLHADHSELTPDGIEGLVADLMRLAVWKRRSKS